jgi:hypothetical protein
VPGALGSASGAAPDDRGDDAVDLVAAQVRVHRQRHLLGRPRIRPGQGSGIRATVRSAGWRCAAGV